MARWLQGFLIEGVGVVGCVYVGGGGESGESSV